MSLTALYTPFYLLCPNILSNPSGRVTPICVGEISKINSNSGLLPGRCQAIILANGGILLIGPLGTNISGILIEILAFSETVWNVCKTTTILHRVQCVSLICIFHIYVFHRQQPCWISSLPGAGNGSRCRAANGWVHKFKWWCWWSPVFATNARGAEWPYTEFTDKGINSWYKIANEKHCNNLSVNGIDVWDT